MFCYYDLPKKFLTAGSLLLLISCAEPDKNLLLKGSWKTDSICSYYNGFDQTKRDFEEEPLRHYKPNGLLTMTRDGESRDFQYQLLHNDTLIHSRQDNRLLEKFYILKLDDRQLVLRKELNPLFPGPHQTRYEIRYLSRVKSQ